jgi:hypothetical protein
MIRAIAIAPVLFAVVDIARRHGRFWQYSLTRLLPAVFLVVFSCGCFGLASISDYQLAIIPGVLSIGLAFGLLTNCFIGASAGVVDRKSVV